MKKNDVLLVLVVILIPIVLLGALAVMGADNIKPSVTFEGNEGAYTVYEYPGTVDVTNGANLSKHADFTFSIVVNEGYSGVPVVTIDGERVSPSTSATSETPYVYTITNIEEPVTVVIGGLTQSA